MVPSRPNGGRLYLVAWVDLNANGEFDEGEPLTQEGVWVVWQPEGVAAMTIRVSATSIPVYTSPGNSPQVEYTATVLNSSGQRVPFASVAVAFEGTTGGGGSACLPNSADENGVCTFTVFSEAFPGPGVVATACFDEDADSVVDPSEQICATAPRVSWTLPESTSGRAVGGGLAGYPDGDPSVIAFTLAASSDGRRAQAFCQHVDLDTHDRLRCLNTTAFSWTDRPEGPYLVIFGTGLFNGVRDDYRIDIDASGESTFIAFTARSGYSNGAFVNGRTGKLVLSQ